MKSQLSTKKYAGFLFFKEWLHIFSLRISNENKQRLYKIQKHPTSLFYHVLLIKQNECMWQLDWIDCNLGKLNQLIKIILLTMFSHLNETPQLCIRERILKWITLGWLQVFFRQIGVMVVDLCYFSLLKTFHYKND